MSRRFSKNARIIGVLAAALTCTLAVDAGPARAQNQTPSAAGADLTAPTLEEWRLPTSPRNDDLILDESDIARAIEEFKRTHRSVFDPGSLNGGSAPLAWPFSGRDLTSRVPFDVGPINARNIPPPLSSGRDRIVIARPTAGVSVSTACDIALQGYAPFAEQPIINDPVGLTLVNAMLDACYGAAPSTPTPSRFVDLRRRTIVIFDEATEKASGR